MAGECPALEMLAAYIEHGLRPEEQDELEAHLIECNLCRKTVVQTFKAREMIAEPIIPPILADRTRR